MVSSEHGCHGGRASQEPRDVAIEKERNAQTDEHDAAHSGDHHHEPVMVPPYPGVARLFRCFESGLLLTKGVHHPELYARRRFVRCENPTPPGQQEHCPEQEPPESRL